MEKDSKVETSYLVHSIEWILNLISLASLYRWIIRLVRMTGRWKDEEVIPYWYAEIYTVVGFVPLLLAFWLVPFGGALWNACVFIGGYRLFDVALGLAQVLVFESRRRRDDEGGYILVREPIRWVVLTIINLTEIVLYFSFAYANWGMGFEPPITTRIAAIYQSMAAFIVGGGAEATTDAARVIIILQLCYFVLFFIVVTPVVLSVVRAKERTEEVLGKDAGPDRRI